jgi:hypothetical protein
MPVQIRRELMPPILDADAVARLTDLAANLDGALPGQWEDGLAEFNRLAGTALAIEDFQYIYESEPHGDWVRRLLYRRLVAPCELTRDEMVEIVSRAMPPNGNADWEFYLQLLLVNCKHPAGSNLIFWPNLVPELPQDREPTAEEIAVLAMSGPRSSGGPVSQAG